ncbi:MAG TPA: phosphatase PAP2 family protein [Steroidobacteraceae bacterium]|nr:phosphatase PAP2 family protein [Steroidobacteraceae bacterium]HNS27067.1 phosphatase PAP2 family protein [Steroidobacteraceae bacterium]
MQGLIARFDVAEYRLCRRLNRGADLRPLRRLFVGASRLGDGMAWYALLLALPWMYGLSALRPALAMAVSALAGLLLYKWLKRTFVRERPFIRHRGISLATAPLDRYSFPSGHTLHAVSFTWQAVAFAPELALALVPLAALIAASRVVLGLHYPTDVLVGAALGAGFGALGAAIA